MALLYTGKIGEKMLHQQPRAVCSGFLCSDGLAEWLTQIRTGWSLVEVERLMIKGLVNMNSEEEEPESSRKAQRAW